MTKESPLKLHAGLMAKVAFARNQNIATHAIARYALSCLDLTSLNGNEDEAAIRNLCAKGMLYHVHSICIYPDKVEQVSKILKDTKIVTATVINFPTGLYRTNSDELATAETTAEDISKAIGMGAGQVDIVYPYSVNRTEQRYIHDILQSARSACPPQVTLKVILETSAYDNTADLAYACKAALAAKVDSLKTSTGKHEEVGPSGKPEKRGATLEAVAVMLQEIEDNRKKTGRRVGIKITGGVSTTEDCAQYVTLNKMMTKTEFPSGELFRFGGSNLLDKLIATINQLSSPVETPTSNLNDPKNAY